MRLVTPPDDNRRKCLYRTNNHSIMPLASFYNPNHHWTDSKDYNPAIFTPSKHRRHSKGSQESAKVV